MTNQDVLARAQVHAQVAVAVELYTIPLYLSAAASLKDTSSPAYAAVVSVATEEMLHLQLAANMCLALDTTPSFTAPIYGQVPTFPDGTPILAPSDPATGDSGVLNAKIGNLVDVLPTMLDIEVPTEFESGALVPPYHSIGQMYDALRRLARRARDQASWTTTHQQSFFGSQTFSQTIASYSDLVQAIEVISEQGEGQAQSPPPSAPFTPSEFMVPAADQLTGMKSDPATLAQYSHFGRFLGIQDLGLTSTDVYSGTANPSSPANLALQDGFASLLVSLNSLWNTGSGNIWSMTKLLDAAAAVWAEGSLPQWTPVG